MMDSRTQQKEGKQRWRSLLRFDMVLLAFLILGWSLIFTTATLGLQRSEGQWLPVGLVSNVAADYSPAPTEVLRLARINPEIIEAIKRDQIVILSTPTPSAVAKTSTPTPTLTATATPLIGELVVSAGGPYYGQEGSLIQVIAKDTGILGVVPGAISYAWDLDDDGQYDDATGISTSVIFYDEGEYPIYVQASDLLGRVDTDTAMVFLSNVPPIVDIGQDIKTGEGQEVAFAATASDPGHDLLFYEWTFGDDSPRVNDILNPVHTYADNGSYTSRLWVRDNDGGMTEKFLTVEVSNRPPLVDAGPDLVTTEGSEVAFSGMADDPGTLDELTYAWDFNYDGRTFTPDRHEKTASIIYPDGPANIVAALRVRDNDDAEAIDTVKVTVNNVPPVITGVSQNSPVGEGSALALTVTATDVGQDKLTFAFDWDGNGSFEAVKQPGAVSNIWYNQDEYTVRIRVDDGDGGQAFTTTTVSIVNEPPVAVANVDSGILEGSPVRFDASDSYDPGRDDVLTYQWNLGDGGSADGKSISHVYADNKVYSTTLTVTDDSGAAGTAAALVTILNANPTANASPDVTINEGDNVLLSLNGTATDPGAADTLAFAWDCDYSGTFAETSGVTGSSPTCSYSRLDGLRNPDDNSFNVALRVRDDDYNPNPSGGNQVGEAFDTLEVAVRNLPPWNVGIVEPTNNPYRTTVGVSTRFRARGTDISADLPLTFRWDFNYDGSTFTEDAIGQDVRRTWTTRGAYRVRLQVEDGDGGVTPDEIEVDIGGVPTAVASAVPNPVDEGMLIALTSRGSSDPDGDDLTYEWNFGDGNPVSRTSNITATHVYTDDGVYTATLRVDDGRGGTATDTALVTVANVFPTAAASADPNPVAEGQSVLFDGRGSGGGGNEPLTYQWDFGDGMAPDNTPNPAHTYVDNGNYTATLTVTDDDGSSDTVDYNVLVNNVSPVVEAGDSYSGVQGQPVTLTGSAVDVPADILIYAWDLDGDGQFDDADTAIASYTWSTGGPHPVALRVTDDDGDAGTDMTSVDIDSIPIASAGGPYGGNEGTAVTFDGSGSSDPDPGDTLTYTWNFGDGSSPGTGVNPTHTYAENGVYNITLQVDDGQGGVATTTTTAAVNNLPPMADAGPDQVVAEGEMTTFNGNGSDPGGGLLTFAWDLDGDGQFDDAAAAMASYSWAEPGTYTAALRVTDAGGLSSIDTVQVTVSNLPPVADAGPDQTVAEGGTVTLNGNGSDPGGGPLSYAWDLDNNGTFETSGQVVSNAWPDNGVFTVSLQVTDNQGSVATDSVQVTVNNVPPQNVDAGGPYATTAGAAVTVTGSGTDVPADPLTYSWNPDGGGQCIPSTGQSVDCSWSITGTHTIMLEVNDGDGGVAQDTATVQVNSILPFVWGPLSYALWRRRRQSTNGNTLVKILNRKGRRRKW